MMMGYFRIFPFGAKGEIKIHLIVVVLGVIMAFIITVYRKKNSNVYGNRAFYMYLTGYILIMLYSSLYTFFCYKYTFREIIIALDPFLYIIFAVPLIYLFYYEQGFEALFKKIIFLELIMLMIKSMAWYSYNFIDIDIFHNILFQYGIWQRDGFQRIDTGLFFGISTVILVYKAAKCNIKDRVIYLTILALLFAYLLFVTRARYQIITFIITVAVEMYYLLKPRSKVFYWLLILGLILIAMIGGHFFDVVLSFSTKNINYGKSTMSRLLTIGHYWQYIVDRKAVFGLGMLNSNNIQAYAIMERAESVAKFYHLTDIGILGGFVRFGILAIWIYGIFYYELINVCYKYKKRKYKDMPVLAGIAVWLILWGVSNNFLDSSRAFEFPFYLAIISYYSGKLKGINKNESL